MATDISIIISIIALIISTIVGIVQIIIAKNTFHYKNNAEIRIKDIENKIYIENIGKGQASNIAAMCVDVNGKKYLAEPIVDSLAIGEKQEIQFKEMIIAQDYITKRVKNTIHIKPKELLVVQIKYRNFRGKSQISRYGVAYSNNSRYFYSINKNVYDDIVYNQNH